MLSYGVKKIIQTENNPPQDDDAHDDDDDDDGDTFCKMPTK